MTFKIIYWLYFITAFYRSGNGAGNQTTELAQAYDVVGNYNYKAVTDSITAHWDTLTVFAPTKNADATTYNFSLWTASQTRTDSFKVYINDVYQDTRVFKTTETLGTYGYTFTSNQLGTLNKLEVVVHVKAGGAGTTLVKWRNKWLLQ